MKRTTRTHGVFQASGIYHFIVMQPWFKGIQQLTGAVLTWPRVFLNGEPIFDRVVTGGHMFLELDDTSCIDPLIKAWNDLEKYELFGIDGNTNLKPYDAHLHKLVYTYINKYAKGAPIPAYRLVAPPEI